MTPSHRCDHCGCEFPVRKDCLAHEKICFRNHKGARKGFRMVEVTLIMRYANGISLMHNARVSTSVFTREQDLPDYNVATAVRYSHSDGWFEFLAVTECHPAVEELALAMGRCRDAIEQMFDLGVADMASADIDFKALDAQVKKVVKQ